mmetsp:Transcript_16199/g.43634  ORF Transcript_16199/g.43634 Transcript_16199/m.43634 type:complete len:166 (+) Transcript_16199:44-541(+)
MAALLLLAASCGSVLHHRALPSAFTTPMRPRGTAPARAHVLLADVLVGTDQDMINITPAAMKQLLSLKEKQDEPGDKMVLRMGVRSGGCSGMSYVMDTITEDAIDETDLLIQYQDEGLVCAIDPKSSMFLYGLQLDYSDDLIGGGFGFKNPNAESTCGCGSSFSV